MSEILYAYNLDAYQAAVKMLRGTGKAAVIHPTGTGKSFIGLKLCADHPKSTVCWLSPSEPYFPHPVGKLGAGGRSGPHKHFASIHIQN